MDGPGTRGACRADVERLASAMNCEIPEEETVSPMKLARMRRTIGWRMLRRARFARRIAKRFLGARNFVPRELGLQGLFEELNDQGCKYVVLRWFEELPRVRPDGDVDLLVEEEDADEVYDLLTRSSGKGLLRCDVYQVRRGADIDGPSHYPIAMGEQILARRIAHVSGAYVPCTEDYFFSLAFHAIYHKRDVFSPTGSEDSEADEGQRMSRDYKARLISLADELGLSIPITRESLGRALRDRGWVPATDWEE